ncbi:MAG: flagellar protein FlgJ [Lentisphaeria bacterium]|jgi:flagellar protein FlgJ
MNPLSSPHSLPAVTDVYTDLNGLQQLKTEGNKDEALKKVAQQFESMFINMMMKNMRAANAVFEKDSPFNSKETEFFRDMHDNQLALTMAHGKGIGIADVLYRQMTRDKYQDSDGLSTPDTYPLNTVMPRKNMANMQMSIAPKVESELQTYTAEKNTASNTKNTSSPSVAVSVTDRVGIADSPKDFIEKILPHAKAAAQLLGIDKYILVAQSALETGWGKHVLANSKGESSNNLFNIKIGNQWGSEKVSQKVLEYKQGVLAQERSEFRVYENVADSFSDYVSFIAGSDRYANAFEKPGDSTHYIQQIHKAGYATDPVYSEKVLAIYQKITSTDQYGNADREGTSGDRL